MVLNIIVSVLVLLLVLVKVYEYILRSRFRDKEGKIIPGIGMFDNLFYSLSNAKTKWRYTMDQFVDKHRMLGSPPVYHTLAGPFSFLWIANPEDAKKLLTSVVTFDKIQTHPHSIFNRFVGKAVGQLPHEDWRNKRKIVERSFFDLGVYLNSFRSVVDKSIDKWESDFSINSNQLQVPVTDQMSRVTLDILGITIFGQNMGAIENKNEELREAYNNTFKYMFKIVDMLFPRLKDLPTKSNLKDREHFKTFEQGIEHIINERKKNPTGDVTMLDLMIDATNDQSSGENGSNEMSALELKQNVVGFFVAGHETTATALTWGLYALGMHPEVQQRCIDEIDRIVGNTNEITIEMINQLDYLSAVIKEVQRIYAVAGLVPRVTKTDSVLSNGVKVPKGTMVTIDFGSLHRNKSVWGEDCDEFRPERFLGEEETKRSRWAYIPFSAGPHMCLGNNFSLLEQKVFYIRTLQKYTFSLMKGFKMTFSRDYTANDNGFEVVLTKRQ
ncbi:cytochrome P450 [Acrasis kona]|uniref:Cytochrome P450 n=1 Tax=Acrasis kona TaxID=1008807 RepID=A0AAW2Z9I8_9EUKA